jgi:hypothetical protein
VGTFVSFATIADAVEPLLRCCRFGSIFGAPSNKTHTGHQAGVSERWPVHMTVFFSQSSSEKHLNLDVFSAVFKVHA